MRRALFALAALVLVAAAPRHATAASTVAGTVSCTAEGELFYRAPYLPGPLAEPLVKPLGVRGSTTSSTCDSSGVLGADRPITRVDARLGGKLGTDTTCENFFATLALTGKVKLRWRSFQPPSGVKTVGTSSATIASAAYDSGTEAWVLVTNPIKSGAFAGSTVTMHFHMSNPTFAAEHCSTSSFRYSGWIAGPDSPWTIDVP